MYNLERDRERESLSCPKMYVPYCSICPSCKVKLCPSLQNHIFLWVLLDFCKDKSKAIEECWYQDFFVSNISMCMLEIDKKLNIKV